MSTFSDEIEDALQDTIRKVSQILPGWRHSSVNGEGLTWRHLKLKTWSLEINVGLQPGFYWLNEIKASAGKGRPPFWVSYARSKPGMGFADGMAYIDPGDAGEVQRNLTQLRTQSVAAAEILASALEAAKSAVRA